MTGSVFFILFRFFVYMLAMFGLVSVAMLEGYSEGTAATYSEDSLTEWLHNLLLAACAAFFLLAAVLARPLRPACVMLAGLSLMMFIRESDAFLDSVLFDGAWQLLATAALVAVILFLWRQSESVAESAGVLASHSSAGLFLGGCVVTLVFSRLFGRADFWQSVMGDGYMRVVKNIAEEATEVVGYGLMTIAAVELLVTILTKRSGAEKAR